MMAHTLPMQQEESRAQIINAEAAKLHTEASKIRAERVNQPADDDNDEEDDEVTLHPRHASAQSK